jgi:hypothetical protein
MLRRSPRRSPRASARGFDSSECAARSWPAYNSRCAVGLQNASCGSKLAWPSESPSMVVA